MNILFNTKMLQHNPDGYPEGKYRLDNFSGWKQDIEINGEEFITLVHTKKYLEKIKKACKNRSYLAEINLNLESYEAACIAVGLTILSSQQNDFAVVRPPGHHASREKTSGFCLFNNIAIATQKLVNEGKRICIFDIDGHHGNGTQSIFYQSNKVLYCSIHQEHIFPGTGQIDEIGVAEGKGFTVNLPIPKNSGDDIFLSALQELSPIISHFKPDIIGVSAGFDGYYQDSLLKLNYSLNSYYECGLLLGQNFKNIFGVLEGGYHNNLKECIDAFVAGINGQKIKIEEKRTISNKNCHNVFGRNIDHLKHLLKQTKN